MIQRAADDDAPQPASKSQAIEQLWKAPECGEVRFLNRVFGIRFLA
jgi:hypothetical protein